ncbi:amino acid adenylation domain-containing protein [Aquimarina algiphila]|uniref:amino acid adenylation domain-containing protein n=1 Tax=Aquimarina algiphila TaxID=2047982 RepID=UPI00232CFA06|nr:amino acid adenylation domain-containing protein [Aquimarina algiphila]
MTIENLLIELRRKGIKIVVKGNDLRVVGNKDLISNEILAELRKKKEGIIDFLSQKKVKYDVLKKFDPLDSYPLSSSQKRMYVTHMMNPESTAYNLPQIFYLGTKIDKKKIVSVFHELIQRHSILRTIFQKKNKIPIQIIKDDIIFEVNEIENEGINENNLIESFIKPFDLGNGPLIRAGLFRKENDNWYLIIDIHHIVTDGVSNVILKKEFIELYGGKTLVPLKFDYVDYCLWQNTSKQQSKIIKNEEFWLNLFKESPPLLNLPLDFPRTEIENKIKKKFSFQLTKEKMELIKSFSLKRGLTTQMSFLSIYGILLSKLSGQEDIVIGNVIEGRNHLDLEKLVGNFINTLVFRLRVDPEMTVSNYTDEIRKLSLEAYENQDYPFERLVGKVSSTREQGRQPIFDVMLNYMNLETNSENIGDLEQLSYNGLTEFQGYDLVLKINDYGENIICAFEYCNQFFKDSTIERFAKYFQNIISSDNLDVENRILDIDILDELERQKTLLGIRGGELEIPDNLTIHQMFEIQAAKKPDKIAVRFKERTITYKELNSCSNHIANLLLKKGISEGERIGILLDKSIEMVIAILGILKVGGTYLPIDPNLPFERKKFILMDSEVKVLFIEKKYDENFNQDINKKIFINDIQNRSRTIENNLNLLISPDNIAYIIYTSGTTGVPKGVLIQHRNVINLMISNIKNFNFLPSDIWTMFHSYFFDFSVWEMFGALLFGGELIVISEKETRDMEAFYDCAVKNKITVLSLTPSEFQYLKSIDRRNKTKLDLKYLFLGGERLNFKNLWDWKRKYNKCKIVHVYGPTETTIISTFKEITYNDISKDIYNIGKPVANLKFYILNDYNKFIGRGIVGEICISGEGVSKGYLNRKELTQEKFISNPYNPGEILYKTGDLGRFLETNEIEFVGRKDNQVKIRGYRIELDEIESTLFKYKNVDEVKVIVHEKDNDKSICAYYVSNNSEIMSAELKEFLSLFLPSYMIPQFFVRLNSLPRGRTGKIDINSLPSPIINKNENYFPPTTEIEVALVDIWSEVLEIEKDKIGIKDNFFELGGHSLKILNVVAAIKEKFDVYIPLMSIYENPYIEYIRFVIETDSYATEDIKFFNPEGKQNIFCLPPGISIGMCYRSLSNKLKEYRLCAFNYKKSNDDVIDFVDRIVKIQEKSPYILLGYSGGGKALYPIALELEKRGKKVSHIISLDGYWENYEYVDDYANNYDDVLRLLNDDYLNDLKIRLENRINDYNKFLSSIKYSEKINSQVYFLVSEGFKKIENEEHMDMEIKKIQKTMNKYSKKPVKILRGIGLHGDILNEKNLLNNSKLILEILNNQ